MLAPQYQRQSHRKDKLPAHKRRGFDSREEERQYRRFERGTRSDKQRSYAGDYDDDFEVQARFIGEKSKSFLEQMWEKIDADAGPELHYPRDAGTKHVYGVGDPVFTGLDIQPIRIVEAFEYGSRLRYRIAFANDEKLCLTQGQLMALADARNDAFISFKNDLVASFLELARTQEMLKQKRGSRRKDLRKQGK